MHCPYTLTSEELTSLTNYCDYYLHFLLFLQLPLNFLPLFAFHLTCFSSYLPHLLSSPPLPTYLLHPLPFPPSLPPPFPSPPFLSLIHHSFIPSQTYIFPLCPDLLPCFPLLTIKRANDTSIFIMKAVLGGRHTLQQTGFIPTTLQVVQENWSSALTKVCSPQ